MGLTTRVILLLALSNIVFSEPKVAKDNRVIVLRCCRSGETLEASNGSGSARCVPSESKWDPLVYSPSQKDIIDIPENWDVKENSRPSCGDRALSFIPLPADSAPMFFETGEVGLNSGYGQQFGQRKYCAENTGIFVCGTAPAPKTAIRRCCGVSGAWDTEGKKCIPQTEPETPLIENMAEYAILEGWQTCNESSHNIVGNASAGRISADGAIQFETFRVPAGQFCIERIARHKLVKVFACSEFAQQRPEVLPAADIRFTLYPVGFLISVVFLAATLAAGWLLPTAHHVLHWRCQTHHVACLMLGDLLMAIIQLGGNSLHGTACKIVAIMAHFFFLAAFFWLNTMCFNIWWTFRYECPNFGDYRVEQCAKYNGKFYKGQSYQWEPFPDAPNDCALNCRAVGERFYATLEPEVLDGTPCRGISRGRTRVPGVLAVGAADHWLCVSGQCKPVGCDGVVGSGRILDACGVCGGEGNSCRLFEGIFLEPKLSNGYQLVTTIPKGAISLNISEVRPSRNSLALRDSNSSFLLNGPSSVSPPGVYGGVGASFSYHRGDAVHPENIWANGPLGEPVDLMILSEDMNPGVLYKYMLPLNEKIDDSAMLAPPLLVAGPNDKIGNEIPELSGPLAVPKTPDIQSKEETAKSSQGVRKGLNNKRRDDKGGMTKMAGDQPMQQTRSVAKERRKKKNNKKFFWKISGLSPCSKACGGGVQHATFKCFRESTKVMAPERRCKRVPRPASPPPLSCNTLPCPARWRAGPWSPCSVTCGAGTQVRKLECVQELNPKLTMPVAPGACIEKSYLKTTMTCKSNPCTSTRAPEARQMQSQIEDTSTSTESRWTTGPWGTCSSTCGSGIRKRQVTCITAGADTCPPDTMPSNQTNCEGLPECTNTIEPKAPWLFTDWSSQCSTDCGIGFTTRQVACNDGNEVFCDATKKPSLTETCAGNGTDCDKIRYQWFVGAWSPCTVSCGSGIRRRDVVCLASVKDDLKISEEKNCGKLTRPLAEERCLTPTCPAEWFTSDWSECSKTCGLGLQTRVVRCLREGLETSGCSNLTEPKKSRVCDNDEPCKSDVAENPVKPPKKVYEKTDCVDKFPNCNLVVKAGVCRMKYYKHSCCSCRD